MPFRLLLDEMTEAGLADYCTKLGHDVERVVEVDALGRGTDDGAIAEYAEEHDRLVVTYDDDFLLDRGMLSRVGVLYQPDDRTPPFETANIIDAINIHVSQAEIVEHDTAFHLTEGWL